ncbi:ECF RNA polymerase sigma-E factor [Planctomycetes bacterium CA13]|uniref:RNA polymerase sigma factor n=1 Tax=Novipirellula herctigrandis TaxID=2527986 RepID=A0A5C5YNG3_9BACT|nr:ECF RNA polymerase sigma-E factor [Planctomycetes bacterium CA13]
MQSTTDFQSHSHLSTYLSQSDSELIASTLMGDKAAYDTIVARYQERLTMSIWNKVGCHELAEDIVQDAFLNAYRHLHSFRNHAQFYTWLYRIALNSRRNYLNKGRHVLSMDALTKHHDQTADPKQIPPVDIAERVEDCIRVRDALSKLDEDHRRILILREFEGYNYQMIAEQLQVKTGTVRSRLSRARAKLRNELDGYIGGKTAPDETSMAEVMKESSLILN